MSSEERSYREETPQQVVPQTVVDVCPLNGALALSWVPVPGAESYRVKVGDTSTIVHTTECVVPALNGHRTLVTVTPLNGEGRVGIESVAVFGVARSIEPLSVSDLEDRFSGRREWLVEGVLIEGTSMVVSAEAKAGKSLALLDLAVALASDEAQTRWMGTFNVKGKQSVLAFWGEDSPEETLRRVKAICEFTGQDMSKLDLRMCFQLPNLSRTESLAQLDSVLADRAASVVILDPLYLAIGENGNGADLYAMGSVLTAFGEVCRKYGATPIVAHHWNKTGSGKGVARAAGTGTVQWARTNISMAVDNIGVDERGRSVAVLDLDISGNSVSPQHKSVRRRIAVTDSSDSLNCPLDYSAHPQEGTSRNTEVQNRIVKFLLTKKGSWVTFTTIRDEIGGRTDTVREALSDLVDGGRVLQARSSSGSRSKFHLPSVESDMPNVHSVDDEQIPF